MDYLESVLVIISLMRVMTIKINELIRSYIIVFIFVLEFLKISLMDFGKLDRDMRRKLCKKTIASS